MSHPDQRPPEDPPAAIAQSATAPGSHTGTVLQWLESTAKDSDRAEFVSQLRHADTHARTIFALGSPLAVGDDSDRVIEATRVLVCGAGNLDNMNGDINSGQYSHDAVTSECLYLSIEAAYRLGITVGLRLADLAAESGGAA